MVSQPATKVNGSISSPRLAAEFATAGNVISFRKWGISEPYSMTNKRLRISLPLTSGPSTAIGILDCHIEDNFDHIGITLFPPYAETTFADQHIKVEVRNGRFEGKTMEILFQTRIEKIETNIAQDNLPATSYYWTPIVLMSVLISSMWEDL